MSYLKETANGLKVGDKVESEIGEDSVSGKVFTTKGVIRKILGKNKVLIAKDLVSDSFLELNADECVKVFDCSDCEDTGYTVVPAHQAYSPTRGTYIEDEKEYICHCKLQLDEYDESDNQE